MGSDQISVTEFEYEETEGDRTRVDATVANDADVKQRVTLTVQMRASDEQQEKSTDVTVRANESEEAEAIFDVDPAAFERDGDLDFDWETRRPGDES